MKFYSFTAILIILAAASGAFFVSDFFDAVKTIPAGILSFSNAAIDRVLTGNEIEIKNPRKHLQFESQFGVYSTVWSARSKRVNDLIRVADQTEINAIVIDVKDSGVYIDDYLKDLVKALHDKNIYAIARLVVFQDSSQIKTHPDWYFKKEDGSLWQDNRGWYWLNPAVNATWDYNIEASKQAIDADFDELNFDYIRYPGFKKDDDVVFSPVFKNRMINDFSAYFTLELKKYDPGIKLSVDLFAYNMLTRDDLGVGQRFTELYDYFDYVSPMIYPSHYLPGNFGFENPAEYPYEVVLETIEKGKAQLWEKSVSETGTTTPSIVSPVYNAKLKKLRPWLQDFNIGAMYDGEMIRKEKQAVYDAGLTSGWLLWNPRNVYTESALDK